MILKQLFFSFYTKIASELLINHLVIAISSTVSKKIKKLIGSRKLEKKTERSEP
jgi:hypothetical protein